MIIKYLSVYVSTLKVKSSYIRNWSCTKSSSPI